MIRNVPVIPGPNWRNFKISNIKLVRQEMCLSVTFAHHKPHMYYFGFEPGPPRLQTINKWQSLSFTLTGRFNRQLLCVCELVGSDFEMRQ